MSSNISRAAIDALLPPGSIWQPGKGFDELLAGISENNETVREFLGDLAFLRDAPRTTILSDLEKEYGLNEITGLTEDERRQRLLSTIIARDSDGTAEFMESALRGAGFDVYVHVNNPPVDPTLFVNEQFVTICNNETAICGRSDAVAGGASGGELIINGDLIRHLPIFTAVCGNESTVCHNVNAVCLKNSGADNLPIEYDIPTDPGYWGLFFFVGGLATMGAITGELETIAFAQIPIARREELRRLIIKYKPVHSWGGSIVEYF